MERRFSACSPWTLVCGLLGSLFLLTTACRAEKPQQPPRNQSTQTSAREQSESLPAIVAGNQQELRERVGQKVVVSGDVSRIGISDSGHRFINFNSNPELSLFISSQDVRKFQPDPPEKLYRDQTIAATGRLERFKEKLQIRIQSPEAIRILEKPATPPDQEKSLPTPVELRAQGRDRWISPAGLRYEGRDPEGNTRKEHVLRHARDFPDRPGPHGVFDGGEELAFAWIDLAWEQIQTQKLKPDREDGRETYTVNMRRRVGYLGGQTGQREQNPPLHRIFLVLRQGTTEVVTAFPK